MGPKAKSKVHEVDMEKFVDLVVAKLSDGGKKESTPRNKQGKSRTIKKGKRVSKPKGRRDSSSDSDSTSSEGDSESSSDSSQGHPKRTARPPLTRYPCYFCFRYGHSGGDHGSVRKPFEGKYLKRWKAGKAAWDAVKPMFELGTAKTQMAAFFEIDLSTWPSFDDDVSWLFAFTETVALRQNGFCRWVEGTQPDVPPPGGKRKLRAPPKRGKKASKRSATDTAADEMLVDGAENLVPRGSADNPVLSSQPTRKSGRDKASTSSSVANLPLMANTGQDLLTPRQNLTLHPEAEHRLRSMEYDMGEVKKDIKSLQTSNASTGSVLALLCRAQGIPECEIQQALGVSQVSQLGSHPPPQKLENQAPGLPQAPESGLIPPRPGPIAIPGSPVSTLGGLAALPGDAGEAAAEKAPTLVHEISPNPTASKSATSGQSIPIPAETANAGIVERFLGEMSPIHGRESECVVATVRNLMKEVWAGDGDPLSILLHSNPTDLLAVMSHLLPHGLMIVFQPVVGVGAPSPWAAKWARVSAVDREGNVKWRVGCKAVMSFVGGREWRIDGEMCMEYSVPMHNIFTCVRAAEARVVEINATSPPANKKPKFESVSEDSSDSDELV